MPTTTPAPDPTSTTPTPAAPLLQIRDLDVHYLTRTPVRACADINLSVHRGEILGIAGESGSGKSTLITAITRLQRPPAATTRGELLYHQGDTTTDLLSLDQKQLRRLRWNRIAVVLQSAMDALNPVMRLHAQFADVLRLHRPELDRAARDTRIGELLAMVGIPTSRSRAYPHELSGGMRQRASIALALACDPELVVMDEPTTAVDVIMQRQIMGQLLRLRREIGFAVVLVTHDLSLLLETADRIAVMYAGRIIETADAATLYHAPRHPYTRGLKNSFPPLHAPLTELHGIPGAPPDLQRLPDGCAFHPRCPHAFDRCRTERPVLDHAVACHLDDHAQENA